MAMLQAMAMARARQTAAPPTVGLTNEAIRRLLQALGGLFHAGGGRLTAAGRGAGGPGAGAAISQPRPNPFAQAIAAQMAAGRPPGAAMPPVSPPVP
jgi:hypothetical protein